MLGVVVAAGRALFHLGLSLGDGLAHLVADQRSEVGLACAQLRRDLCKQLAAPREARIAPNRKGRGGAGQHALDFVLTVHRVLGERRAARRIDRVNRMGRRGGAHATRFRYARGLNLRKT